jgi:hypothetical protein
MRKALQSATSIAASKGVIPVLQRKPGARLVTSQHVEELLEAEN